MLDALRLERARNERAPLGRDDHHRRGLRNVDHDAQLVVERLRVASVEPRAHDVAPRRNRAGGDGSPERPGRQVERVRALLAPVDEDAHDAVRAGRRRAAELEHRLFGLRRVARGADGFEARVAAARRGGGKDERGPSRARAPRTRRAARRAPSVNITTARSPSPRTGQPEQRHGGVRVRGGVAGRGGTRRGRAVGRAAFPVGHQARALAERRDARLQPLLARPGPHLFERLGARLRSDAARRVDEDVEARRRGGAHDDDRTRERVDRERRASRTGSSTETSRATVGRFLAPAADTKRTTNGIARSHQSRSGWRNSEVPLTCSPDQHRVAEDRARPGVERVGELDLDRELLAAGEAAHVHRFRRLARAEEAARPQRLAVDRDGRLRRRPRARAPVAAAVGPDASRRTARTCRRARR